MSYAAPIILVILAITLVLTLLGKGDDRIPDRDGRHWKLGIFYADPEDPRLVVRHRVGIGRTLNYGHAVAWIYTLAPLVLAVLLARESRS